VSSSLYFHLPIKKLKGYNQNSRNDVDFIYYVVYKSKTMLSSTSIHSLVIPKQIWNWKFVENPDDKYSIKA
jgi:hypothetical protein